MENNSNNQPAPPPGYPTAAGAEQPAGGRKSRRGSTKARGEEGFIEGCIAALCCFWICDMCCDPGPEQQRTRPAGGPRSRGRNSSAPAPQAARGRGVVRSRATRAPLASPAARQPSRSPAPPQHGTSGNVRRGGALPTAAAGSNRRPSPPPCSSSGGRIREKVCILTRTPQIDAHEQERSRALLADVGGNRPLPRVDADGVKSYLIDNFQVSAVTVHSYHPEDFLIMFANLEDQLLVLQSPCPAAASFSLIVKPWSRHAQAASLPMPFTVHVSMSGIPAHLWLESTAQAVLGTGCNIISIASETTTTADLARFNVTVACFDLDLIPTEKVVALPESGEPHICLTYPVDVTILRVEECPLQNHDAGLDGAPPPGGRSS